MKEFGAWCVIRGMRRINTLRAGSLLVLSVFASAFGIYSAEAQVLEPVGHCVVISSTLSLGQSGASVIALQEFLRSRATEVGWPEGVGATGYFGPITLAAVQRLQASNGIVSSGTPFTTGYGLVGPRTRALILKLSCSIVPPPIQDGLEVITPSGGEDWQIGSNEYIRWTSSSNTQVDIILNDYMTPCSYGEVCPMMPVRQYPVISGISGSIYLWNVGSLPFIDSSLQPPPPGKYILSICTASACDYSNSYFTIYTITAQ